MFDTVDCLAYTFVIRAIGPTDRLKRSDVSGREKLTEPLAITIE